MASLAELRAAAGASKRLRTFTYDLCLAQDLMAENKALQAELRVLQVEMGLAAAADEDSEEPADDQPARPSRIGDPRQTRVIEIKARLAELADDMREASGTLLLTAIPAGEWRRWVDSHPARETGRDEKTGRPILNPLDERLAYGLCNVQALADNLHRFVTTWNEQPVSDEDWAYVLDNAAPGDINEILKIVVGIHEAAGERAPKSLSTFSSVTGVDAIS